MIAVTEEVLVDWLLLGAALRAKRRSAASPDLLIAASARFGRLIVATRNVKHFAECDVAVFNLWTGELHALAAD